MRSKLATFTSGSSIICAFAGNTIWNKGKCVIIYRPFIIDQSELREAERTVLISRFVDIMTEPEVSVADEAYSSDYAAASLET